MEARSKAESVGSSSPFTSTDQVAELATETNATEGGQMQAKKKFFATPELLELVFEHLPEDDILSLTLMLYNHVLTKALTVKIWKRLVTQKLNKVWTVPDPTEAAFTYPEIKEDWSKILKSLGTLLKRMNLPKQHLNFLLVDICKRYEGEGMMMRSADNNDVFKVSPIGFGLLEEVEGALGTAEQEIQSINLESTGLCDPNETYPRFLPCISALESRLSRQKDPPTKLKISRLFVEDPKGADHFHKILNICQEIEVDRLMALERLVGGVITGLITQKGWHIIAKALLLKPEAIKSLYATKPSLADAEEEDLRTIFENVGLGGVNTFKWRHNIASNDWHIHIKPEDGFQRLKQVLQMSEEEYAKEIPEEKQPVFDWPVLPGR